MSALPDKPSIFSAADQRPTSTSLDALTDAARVAVSAALADLEAQGFAPSVYETYRSPERGLYLLMTHRSQLGAHSLHCARLAADIIDGRKDPDGRMVAWGAPVDDGTPSTNARRAAMAREFFAALGTAAKAHGLTWGGDWRTFPDLAHVQLGDGRG